MTYTTKPIKVYLVGQVQQINNPECRGLDGKKMWRPANGCECIRSLASFDYHLLQLLVKLGMSPVLSDCTHTGSENGKDGLVVRANLRRIGLISWSGWSVWRLFYPATARMNWCASLPCQYHSRWGILSNLYLPARRSLARVKVAPNASKPEKTDGVWRAEPPASDERRSRQMDSDQGRYYPDSEEDHWAIGDTVCTHVNLSKHPSMWNEQTILISLQANQCTIRNAWWIDSNVSTPRLDIGTAVTRRTLQAIVTKQLQWFCGNLCNTSWQHGINGEHQSIT